MATISAVIKYATNLDELRAELKAGTDQLVVLEQAAERTTRNLGGEGLMRAAHNAAAAIESLGGASKLTSAEQEKASNLISRAIEKYQALGQAAPAALKQIHEAIKVNGASLSSLDDHLQKIQDHIKSFSGGKVIQDAHQLARAVTEVGGADKLTAVEQARVNAVVTEAIAKYRALGKEAPAALHALEAQTSQLVHTVQPLPGQLTQMSQKTGDWSKALVGLGSALGVTFSIGAVVGFTKELLRAGDEIQKMADKTSIGTENVQRLDFVASQAGVSFEGIVSAVQNLQQRLGDNDSGAIGALGKLGINLDAFLKLDPYEQFVQLSEAIGKIEDPTQRAAIAADVFGKSWKEIGPAVISNIREIADSAPVMADATVKSLDAAGDAIDKFWRMVKSNAANQIGLAILSIQALPKEMNMAFKAMHLDVDAAKKDVQDLAGWWDVLVQKVEKPPKVGISQAVKDAFSGPGVPKIKLTPDEITGIINDLNGVRKSLDDADKAVDTHALKIRELAAAYAGTKAINDANDAIAAVNQNLDKGIEISEMTEAQQIALNRVVNAAIDVYKALGREAPQALIDIQQETQKVIDVQENAKAALDEWAEAVKRHQEEYKRGEAETVAFLEQQEQERIDAAKAALDDYTEAVRQHQAAQKQGEEETLKALDEQRKKYQEVQKAVHELGSALADLASVSGGAFGEIINDLSIMVGSFDHAKSSIGEFKDGLASLKTPGGGLSGILEMTTGLLGMASAAITAGKAIANLFDRNKGRDLVTAFAGEHGGFDALHQELLTKLGDVVGEKFWIELTQLVARNDRAGAQRVIDELTKALGDATVNAPTTMADQVAAAGFKTNEQLRKIADDAVKLWEYMRDRGEYSAEQVQAAWERAQQALAASGDTTAAAVQQAQAAVQELDNQIASLNQSIANEAPEEEMGIIERNTRARIASLEAQREEAAHTLEELTQNMTDSIHEVADAIRDLPKEIELAIRLNTEIPEPTPGGPTVNVSTGGYVTPTGIQRFAEGGIVADAEHYAGAGVVRFAPQGMDTQPAMLSVGEGVVNVHPGMDLLGPAGLAAINAGKIPSQLAAGADEPQRPIYATTILNVDSREFARATAPVLPNQVRRLGVRVRS